MSTLSAGSQRHDPREGLDADGLITTGADRDAVPSAFEPVVRDLVESVDADVEVYLYGSVATGQATPGDSDVDVLTIGLSSHRARRVAAELSGVHRSRCRAVEIAPAHHTDFVGPGDEAYGNRVFLHHYCVHVAGPQRQTTGPHLGDVCAARGFNGDIARHLLRWEQLLTAENAEAVARMAARKTLLAVAGLVSVHDGCWTTDRRLAAERWALVDPSLRSTVQQLIDWCTNSTGTSVSDVRATLSSGVSAIVEQFGERIGCWESPS